MKRIVSVTAVLFTLLALFFSAIGTTFVRASVLNFLAPASYLSGWYVAVKTGDFNSDGVIDLAAANYDNILTVLLGKGDGTFNAPVNYGVGTKPNEMAVGDFNNDGTLDLVSTNDSTMSVLLGIGDGTFNTAVNYNVYNSPISVAVGDFNKDGKLDLVIANYVGSCVSVMRGNGDGTFNSPSYVYGFTYPHGVAVGDFNNDGKPDITVAQYGNGAVGVLIGKGDGTFNSAVNYSAGAPFFVTVADLNNDNKQDILSANYSTNGSVSVLLGIGDGTFNAAVAYPTGAGAMTVAVGDLNDDGKPDLAVANGNNSSVSVLTGLGDGTFNPHVLFSVASQPQSIAVADFNADGMNDLVTAHFGGYKLNVLLNALIHDPAVSTSAATSVTANSATLNGTVNARGHDATVSFEYGLSTSYGSNVSADQSPVGGSSDMAVSKAIAGLTPNTVYHFRVVAVNAGGTSYGSDQTFTTSKVAPTVSTGAVSSFTDSWAVLTGVVNANNDDATVTFEYGLDTSYGMTPIAAVQSPVSGTTDVPVNQTITGLSPVTLYHFRVKAVNAGGTMYGLDQTFTTAHAPGIQYVTPTVSGLGDCSSWANACTLQNALTYAVVGDEIWVAAGIYKPTSGIDRTATFQLKNGVTVYGGFAGTETARAQRNVALNVTTLSGDLLGNDFEFANNGENSYHVVTGASGATLDGFTVAVGNANGASPYNSGGGMYNNGASPTVTNVTFSDNSATTSGGGMYNYNSSPTVTNVTFSDNLGDYGGGMYNYNSSPTVTNVTFSGNAALDGNGGGMYNNGASPTLTNVTFSGNSAYREARLPVFGSGMYNYNSSPTLNNVIIANSSSNRAGDCYNSGGTLNAASANNLIESASSACGLTNGVNGNIVGFDPMLGPLGGYGGATQTFLPLPGSPAIGAGNDTTCAAAPVNNLDQRGVTRPQGTHCDIGAVEIDPSTFHTISGSVGVSGVTVNYGAASVTSSTGGSYSFQVYDGWTGTVTPTKAGYAFEPVSKTYSTPVTGDISVENYTAHTIVDISGKVSASGEGVEGVAIAYTGGSTVTDVNGDYLFTVLVGWSGTVTPSKTGYHFTPVNKSYVTIVASQTAQDYAAAINTYTLTYTADANGTITGTSSQTVNHGASGTQVTAVANTGYHFVNWSDGILTASRTDTNATADKSVTATFAINTYALTYAAGEHGSISGSSSQTVNHGADGTEVTAVADEDYHFVSWSDGVLTAARTDASVTGDISVTATFALNAYALTYTAGEHGSITGTSPQAVNHGASGTEVTAVADTGYHFVSWSDGILTAARTDTNVTADFNVTATFAINTYTLTYTAGANGSITGTTSQTVNHGASGTEVTAVADTGYHFVSWSDGLLTASRTDTNITGNITVTAAFALNNHAPTDIGLTASSINENQPVGTTIGTLTTTDLDAGDTFTYSLTCAAPGADDASFIIVNDALNTAAVFDYETKASYAICVRTTDSGGLFFDKDFTITVNNVIETLTVTLRSTGTLDGWLLESGENTLKGGTMDVKATTLRLGDDVAKKQYRSILSFATGAALPDTAVITKVTLKVKRQGIVGGGNPVSLFKGFMVDIRKGTFGISVLQLTDWQTPASKSYGPFNTAVAGGWYTIDLTAGKAYINPLGAFSGLTQFRLGFKIDDNNDGVANYLSLYSGNAPAASQPLLILQYYVP
jgi:predicted outer membrane repeat protein